MSEETFSFAVKLSYSDLQELQTFLEKRLAKTRFVLEERRPSNRIRLIELTELLDRVIFALEKSERLD